MDIFIPLHRDDLPLLRLCVESIETYYSDLSKIFVAYDADLNAEAIASISKRIIPVPIDTVIGRPCRLGHMAQMLAKLTAHHLVDTEAFLCFDADHLVVNKFADSDLKKNDSFIWYYSDWTAYTEIWREGSTRFLDHEIPFNFMAMPPYILTRSDLDAFWSKYSPDTFLANVNPQVSEFVSYGAFMFRNKSKHYEFEKVEKNVSSLTRMLSQYTDQFVLDSAVRFADFPDVKFCSFWSHWNLSLCTMQDFLTDSVRRNFNADRDLARDVHDYPEALAFPLDGRTYAEFSGIHNDGWVSSLSWARLSIPIDRNDPKLIILGYVPLSLIENVSDPRVSVSVNSDVAADVSINAGPFSLVLPVPVRQRKVHLSLRFNWQSKLSEDDNRRVAMRLLFVGFVPSNCDSSYQYLANSFRELHTRLTEVQSASAARLKEIHTLTVMVKQLQPRASRYDKLIATLWMPDGPRSLKIVMPLARLIRKARTLLGPLA